MSSIRTNTIYNMIKTCSSIMFPLITFPYISRILLPEYVGKYNFASSYVSYFALVASLGITTYAIRECARVRENSSELSKVASQIFSINIYTTLLAYILLAISLVVFRRLDDYRLLVVIQSVSIIFTTLGADWLNSAMEDFKYITIRTIAFQIFSVVCMFLFVKRPEDYLKYVVISVIASGGANILNIWYRKKYCDVKIVKDVQWRVHFRPIVLLFVMILSQTIFNNVDITMLGIIKGDFEVGIYTTSVKIINLLSQVVSSIVWVMMPRLSFYFADKNYEVINNFLRKVLGLFITLGLPCVVGGAILAKEIIYIIAGNEYMTAVTPLRILMIAFFFSLFGGSFLGNMVLLSSQKEKEYMIVCLVTAGINIITNAIFIPFFGVNAAAATTAFSSFIIFILLLWNIDSNIYIQNIRQLFVEPLIGCGAIICVCEIISRLFLDVFLRIIISLCGSILIYGVILIILKNDIAIDMVNSIKSKMKGIMP